MEENKVIKVVTLFYLFLSQNLNDHQIGGGGRGEVES
jgi:hypothetical protein